MSRQLCSSVPPCPWGTGEGAGEALLGLHQRTCIFLRTMLPDPVVCPSLAKDRAPRCALESFCRRIPVSAHLAGVGLLIAFLSTLGCFVRAPGMAVHLCFSSPLVWNLRSNFSNLARFCYSVSLRGSFCSQANYFDIMFYSHVVTLAVSLWGPTVTQPSVMIIK